MTNYPFFIIGCVRSGTTLLRDLLKQHPNLCCPEETHFFRWSDPFGSEAYLSNYVRKELFKEHRKLDGVDDFDFFYTLLMGTSRKVLMDHYARIYLEKNELVGRRWFDKSPQNVYGLLMMSGMYPEAKFLHIHRHPYNVVASLKAGKVLGSQGLTAAINFWVESLTIIREYKLGFPQRILEVGYEELASKTSGELNKILDFVEESNFKPDLKALPVHREKNLYMNTLTKEEIQTINDKCGGLMREYGYSS